MKEGLAKNHDFGVSGLTAMTQSPPRAQSDGT
jgi:hypothetical protein